MAHFWDSEPNLTMGFPIPLMTSQSEVRILYTGLLSRYWLTGLLSRYWLTGLLSRYWLTGLLSRYWLTGLLSRYWLTGLMSRYWLTSLLSRYWLTGLLSWYWLTGLLSWYVNLCYNLFTLLHCIILCLTQLTYRQPAQNDMWRDLVCLAILLPLHLSGQPICKYIPRSSSLIIGQKYFNKAVWLCFI